MRRTLSLVLVALTIALGCSSCLQTPGDTSKIEFVSTTTTGGWRYDYFRNLAYPCSISGHQTVQFRSNKNISATVRMTNPEPRLLRTAISNRPRFW